MKPIRTISQYLPSLKDTISFEEITCIEYEVPRKDRNFVYVGQTKQDLNSRLTLYIRGYFYTLFVPEGGKTPHLKTNW